MQLVEALDTKSMEIQIQAVCTARLKLPAVCKWIPYGKVKPGEICGLGYPGQMWTPYKERTDKERRLAKGYTCDLFWTRLMMERLNPQADPRLDDWIRDLRERYKRTSIPRCGCDTRYSAQGTPEMGVKDRSTFARQMGQDDLCSRDEETQ